MTETELKEFIKAISANYKLSETITHDVIIYTLNESLSRYYGYAVQLCLSPFKLKGYPVVHGNVREVNLVIHKIKSKDMSKITDNICRALQRQEVIETLIDIDKYRTTIQTGMIRQITEHGAHIVQLNNLHSEAVCICELFTQIPSERGRQSVGNSNIYYVTSTTLDVISRTPRAKINLNRTSIKLPALYLRQATGLTDIQCIKRLPGVISKIQSSKKMDNNILKTLTRELGGEYMKVRYRGKPESVQ